MPAVSVCLEPVSRVTSYITSSISHFLASLSPSYVPVLSQVSSHIQVWARRRVRKELGHNVSSFPNLSSAQIVTQQAPLRMPPPAPPTSSASGQRSAQHHRSSSMDESQLSSSKDKSPMTSSAPGLHSYAAGGMTSLPSMVTSSSHAHAHERTPSDSSSGPPTQYSPPQTVLQRSHDGVYIPAGNYRVISPSSLLPISPQYSSRDVLPRDSQSQPSSTPSHPHQHPPPAGPAQYYYTPPAHALHPSYDTGEHDPAIAAANPNMEGHMFPSAAPVYIPIHPPPLHQHSHQLHPQLPSQPHPVHGQQFQDSEQGLSGSAVPVRPIQLATPPPSVVIAQTALSKSC